MIPAKFNLDGKVAIVVGDGQNLQAAMASYLLEAGASVAIVDESDDRLAKSTASIQSQNERLMALRSNLTDSREIDDTINKIIAKWGKIDILVNNLAQRFAKPIADTTIEEWNGFMQFNLTGMFLWCKEAGKHMIAGKRGSIVSITSILAERGLTNSTAFCTVSGGVSQFTKSLALEWASKNVRVNAIGLGWLQQPGRETDKSEARLQRHITLGRFCKPEDVAVMLIYLASPASSYVTGQTYYISGGVMSHG